mmetsp:Transcript_35154/g.74805  ORF Transcript_35154/g.74805 Transcript_35154/m.74805 type:complete len:210 (+) Transcript_35154:1152-1781(+)
MSSRPSFWSVPFESIARLSAGWRAAMKPLQMARLRWARLFSNSFASSSSRSLPSSDMISKCCWTVSVPVNPVSKHFVMWSDNSSGLATPWSSSVTPKISCITPLSCKPSFLFGRTGTTIGLKNLSFSSGTAAIICNGENEENPSHKSQIVSLGPLSFPLPLRKTLQNHSLSQRSGSPLRDGSSLGSKQRSQRNSIDCLLWFIKRCATGC